MTLQSEALRTTVRPNDASDRDAACGRKTPLALAVAGTVPAPPVEHPTSSTQQKNRE
jgi:hypothetical protein